LDDCRAGRGADCAIALSIFNQFNDRGDRVIAACLAEGGDPATVNGAPRSETNTNGEGGDSRCPQLDARQRMDA
jgi:hypothetical protein